MKVSKLLKLDPEVVKGLSLQAIEKGITFKRHAENILTEASLTDTQRIEAYYNKDKDTFTPISRISKKLQEEILINLSRK